MDWFIFGLLIYTIRPFVRLFIILTLPYSAATILSWSDQVGQGLPEFSSVYNNLSEAHQRYGYFIITFVPNLKFFVQSFAFGSHVSTKRKRR